jgi:hypothetical protein
MNPNFLNRFMKRGPNGQEQMFEYREGSTVEGSQFSSWGSGNWGNEPYTKKLDEARERLNSKQAGINASRQNKDQVFREWARGEQTVANARREQFRNSLSEHEREQIEQRIQELLEEHPELSPVNVKQLGGSPPRSVDSDLLEEYYFLRELVG